MNVSKVMIALAMLAMAGSTVAQELGSADDFDALAKEEAFWGGGSCQVSISMPTPVTLAAPPPRPPASLTCAS